MRMEELLLYTTTWMGHTNMVLDNRSQPKRVLTVVSVTDRQ